MIGAHERNERNVGRLNNLTAWLGVFAAAMTLAAGILGFTAYDQRQARQDVQSQNDGLEEQIAAKQRELAQINSQLQTAQQRLADAGLPPVGPENPEAGTVLRKGRLSLSVDYCADLDTAIPNWRVSNDCNNNYADIENSDFFGSLHGKNDVDFALLSAGDPASFSACLAATNYATGVGHKEAQRGARFCARTSDGNLAVLQVDSVEGAPEEYGTAVLSVVVWKVK